MDSQYESMNVTDFDVVRSTQFVDELPRGVCVHSLLCYPAYLGCVQCMLANFGLRHEALKFSFPLSAGIQGWTVTTSKV